MLFDDKSSLFVIAWIHCLNNFHCRQLAMRVLNLKDVANLTFERKCFPQTLNALLKRNKDVCVVKRFGLECHWILLASRGSSVYIFNTSTKFDMSDVETAVHAKVHRVRCAHLQQEPSDCFCQTWSIVCAYAAAHDVKVDARLFDRIARVLWKSPVRQWVKHEMARLQTIGEKI